MKSKKLWITLIELLAVIAVLGIIAWIALPKVSNTKSESRDILRKTQLNEIWAAITSYGINHGGTYPISNGTCISSLTELVDEWYLNSINPDPNGEIIHTVCKEGESTEISICPEWYYNYISDGSRFVLAAYMENNKNWNYICLNSISTCTNNPDKTHLCQDLAELWSGWDLSKFLSNNRLNDWLKSNIYVYLRE